MSTAPRQTEAQRLADELDTGDFDVMTNYQAADLLRRQDELLEQALGSLDYIADAQSNPARRDFPTIHDYGRCRRLADAIRAHREAK